MPKLSSSVGKSAPNRPHDVALIQAALANLPASPNSPFGQKIWTKQVDGRTSPDLERAITLFQSNNRITQSARIDPMGPDIQALDRTLPPDRKGIAAVENCTAVLCTSINASSMAQAQEALRKRTLLPGPAAAQLGDVVRDIQKQMGLVLRPDGHGIDQQGRMVQKLTFPGLRQGKRRHPLDEPVRPVHPANPDGQGTTDGPRPTSSPAPVSTGMAHRPDALRSRVGASISACRQYDRRQCFIERRRQGQRRTRGPGQAGPAVPVRHEPPPGYSAPATHRRRGWRPDT